MAMYLLWEDATPPSGWEIDTSHDDRLLMAGSTYEHGGSGSTSHNHPLSTPFLFSYYLKDNAMGSAACAFATQYDHHPVDPTGNTAPSNLPAYRSVRLIRNLTGSFNIPLGAIGFAKTAISNYTSQNDYLNKYIYIKNDAPYDGGGNTAHTHTRPSQSGMYAGDNAGYGRTYTSPLQGTPKVHYHNISGSIDNATLPDPNYMEMMMVKAGINAKIPVGLIVMFDVSPPSSFEACGVSGKHIKHGVYGTTGGSDTMEHTHTHNLQCDAVNPTCGPGDPPSGEIAPHDHVHPIDMASATPPMPPYAQFIFAEYTGTGIIIRRHRFTGGMVHRAMR